MPESVVLTRGATVLARDAKDRWLRKRVVAEQTEGRDFLVVIVCREEEWAEALAAGREPEGVAWPAEDIRLPD